MHYSDVEGAMKKILCIVLPIVSAVGIVLILHANLLFPWQWTARKNKLAVFEYVDSTYSDAKFIRAYYNSTKIAGAGHDQFVFERNRIKFSVYAEHGRVANDFYWYAFAEHQLITLISSRLQRQETSRRNLVTLLPICENFSKTTPMQIFHSLTAALDLQSTITNAMTPGL